MRTQFGGIALWAIDYEIVTMAPASDSWPPPSAVGTFQDGHLRADESIFRFVVGYLSFESASDGESVLVLSHGQPVATVDICARTISMRFRGCAIIRGEQIHLPDAGLGVLPRGRWVLEDKRLTLGLEDERAYALIVHGPAPSKVSARMALAESLEAVGGRHR